MRIIDAMTQDLRQAITEAPNLEALLEALRALESAIADMQSIFLSRSYRLGCTTIADMQSCDAFVRALEGHRVDTIVDVSSLPVFGGEEPNNTIGVWSWDEARLLVGEGSWAECEIVDRSDQ
jgi:hypothetical protein